MSPSDDPSAHIDVNGARLLPDLSGALFWPAASALIVADLHFEKASSFAQKGVALPPYDTSATLNRLTQLVQAYAPSRLISLGDAFHDTQWASRMSPQDRARLKDLAQATQMIWVLGNHDPEPPAGLPGMATDVYRLHADGHLVFRHEPLAVQDPSFEIGEVAGHLHPCGRIRQRGRSLRKRCFVSDGTRLILPAFGALTGSLNVRDLAFQDLFSHAYHVWLLGERRMAKISRRQLLPDRG
jgi:DNA ligase-associated metallophosphoesterase